MKKIYVIGIVAILMIVSAIATVGGWRLLTATSHFNIVEGVEIQYFEVADGQWHSLPVDQSNVDFGEASLKAGESNSFLLRARNTASSGNLGLTVVMDDANWLYHTVDCVADSTGTKYTFVDGNTVYVELPSGSAWKTLSFGTGADGETPIGEILFNNTVSRGNALSEYTSECP